MALRSLSSKTAHSTCSSSRETIEDTLLLFVQYRYLDTSNSSPPSSHSFSRSNFQINNIE
eukprot:scaffold36036_cov222-Skeletonema_dohrnii-CCMP3373.AAC.2